VNALLRGGAVLLLAAMFSGSLGQAAHAHANVIETQPTANAFLDSAPTKAAVEFDSQLMSMGSAMVVRDGNGRTVSRGEPAVHGRRISIAVDGDAGPGQYTVAFRAVSEDGHTVTSSYSYVVKGVVPSTEAAVQSTAPTAESPAGPTTSSAGGSTLALLGLALMLAVVAVGFVVFIRYRSRSRRRSPSGRDTDARTGEDSP